MPMQAEELFRVIANLIPEGYVDLIRRIVPGITIFVTLYLLTGFPQSTTIWNSTTWSFIVFLLLSYVVGLIIDSVSAPITSKCSKRYAWKGFGSDSEEAKVVAEVFRMHPDKVNQPENCKELRKWRIPGLMRAEVIQKDPRAAALLPKLVAEEFLLKNLALGILLMFILFIYIVLKMPELDSSPPIMKDHPRFIVVLFVVFEILVVVGAIHRVRRTAVRTREWFRLVYREKFTASVPAASPDLAKGRIR